MKPEELKEYLSIVVDMEKNIFMQDQTMSQWEREIVGLGKAYEFQTPAKPEEKPMPEWVIVFDDPAPPRPTPPEQPKILRYPKRAFCITAAIFFDIQCIWVSIRGFDIGTVSCCTNCLHIHERNRCGYHCGNHMFYQL